MTDEQNTNQQNQNLDPKKDGQDIPAPPAMGSEIGQPTPTPLEANPKPVESKPEPTAEAQDQPAVVEPYEPEMPAPKPVEPVPAPEAPVPETPVTPVEPIEPVAPSAPETLLNPMTAAVPESPEVPTAPVNEVSMENHADVPPFEVNMPSSPQPEAQDKPSVIEPSEPEIPAPTPDEPMAAPEALVDPLPAPEAPMAPVEPVVAAESANTDTETVEETFSQVEEVHTEVPAEISESSTVNSENVPGEPSLNEQKDIYEKPKKKKSKLIMFGLIGFVVALLATIGVGLLLFVGNNDSSSNPLFQSLGIEAPTIMTFVILVAIVVLGIFTLSALIGLLISLFKMMGAKDDKPKKKKALLSVVISFVLMALFATGLILASGQLSKFNGESKKELIVTIPEDTTGLTAPIEIQFDATQLPIDKSRFEIIGYVWDFDDGERATGPIVKHTFASKPADGLYEVELTVQYKDLADTSGTVQTDTFTRTIAIENQSVAAVFSYDPEEPRAPAEIYFDASESVDPDGEIVSFEWDFDADGEFEEEGEEVTHLFELGGEYDVTLRVLDTNGEFTELTKTILVKDDNIIKPVVKVNPDDEFLAPDIAYQFDATESTSDEGNVISYEWIFGDGSRGEGRKFTHAYSVEGVYTLILKLKDDAGNEREYEKEIRVSSSSSGLFAKIQTVPELNEKELYGTVPFVVNFDGGNSSGGEIVDYEWDFDGDGQSDASGKNIEHTFETIGEFDVFLTITSAEGKSATETIKVYAESPGLQAKITANPVNGTVPLTVTLDATGSRVPNDVSVVSFVWDFDDGTPIDRSNEPRVTHRYSQIGTFNPSVKLITSDNDFSEASTVININSIPLSACFTMSRKIGPAPLTVTFNSSCSTGTVQAYSWKFGEVGVSTKNKPMFVFDTPGEYNISLEVLGSDNNVSIFEDTVIVE